MDDKQKIAFNNWLASDRMLQTLVNNFCDYYRRQIARAGVKAAREALQKMAHAIRVIEQIGLPCKPEQFDQLIDYVMATVDAEATAN